MDKRRRKEHDDDKYEKLSRDKKKGGKEDKTMYKEEEKERKEERVNPRQTMRTAPIKKTGKTIRSTTPLHAQIQTTEQMEQEEGKINEGGEADPVEGCVGRY